MNEPQRSEHVPFAHWTNNADRSCWTCAQAIGYDGVQRRCDRFRIVVIDARSCWERGAGSTSLNPPAKSVVPESIYLHKASVDLPQIALFKQ